MNLVSTIGPSELPPIQGSKPMRNFVDNIDNPCASTKAMNMSAGTPSGAFLISVPAPFYVAGSLGLALTSAGRRCKFVKTLSFCALHALCVERGCEPFLYNTSFWTHSPQQLETQNSWSNTAFSFPPYTGTVSSVRLEELTIHVLPQAMAIPRRFLPLTRLLLTYDQRKTMGWSAYRPQTFRMIQSHHHPKYPTLDHPPRDLRLPQIREQVSH